VAIRIFATLFVFLALSTPAAGSARLVLFIVVDGLAGDVPGQYADRFGDGGFRELFDRGVRYTNAHYRHAATFTAAGHATLFTGGNPREHGMVGNDWQDDEGRHVYCVEDSRHTLLDAPTDPRDGTSPRNLTSTTVGDEMILASGGRSRVFSVSIKDRGAIIPAGRFGKAFWYSGDVGRFVTSTYYYRASPEWVNAWNDAGHVASWCGRDWTLLHDAATYARGDDDDRAFEVGEGSLGQTFPHPLRDSGETTCAKTLRYTPAGDDLTASFAVALLEHERLGRGEAVDLLAVSFSSTDYVCHAYGPNSLEAEDNLLRLDRAIARLLAAVDRAVGLEHTLVVLSSDHGMDAAPEHRCDLAGGYDPAAAGMQVAENGAMVLGAGSPCGGAGRHGPQHIADEVRSVLRERFGAGEVGVTFYNPGLFLDLPELKALGLDVGEVEREIAERLSALPGVAGAVARTDIVDECIPDTPHLRMIGRSTHPARSCNVYILQEPAWLLHPSPLAYTAMHGSPYAYDTHVPVIMAGPGIEPGIVRRRIGPEDVAPTLAVYLGVKAPSGCTGEHLHEIAAPR
jgi:predicted AlkP superfamily pyrophosphatase or phosphodiesterase